MTKDKSNDTPEVAEKDGPGPWTIRDFPADVRGIAIRKARESKINIGEWVSRAIREKIKNDRQKTTEVATREKKPVDIMSASQVVDMLERLHKMDIELPDSLKKQALTLIRTCLTDVRQGNISVGHTPKEIRHQVSDAESD